jgi:hypothetical protein
VDGAVLAIGGGPALLDRLDQTGSAVGDDQKRRPEPASDQVAAELDPVLVELAHPEHHRKQHALALFGESPGDKDALLRPVGTDRKEDGVEEGGPRKGRGA